MRIVQFRKKQDKEAKHICLGLQIPSNASNHEVVDRGDVVDIPQSLPGLQDCTSIDLIMKWDSVKEKLERFKLIFYKLSDYIAIILDNETNVVQV